MADIESPDRVGVRVFPDMRRFLPELRASLKRIERQVKIEVPVVPDVKHLRGALKQAARQAAKGAPVHMPVTPEFDSKKMQDDLDRETRTNPPRVPVAANLDGFQRDLQRNARKVLDNIEINAPLTVDGENMRREAQRVAAQLETEMRRMSLEVPLDAGDSARARAKLSSHLAQLQQVADRMPVDLPVSLRDGQATAAGALASREANAAAGPIRLGVDVDRAALSRVGSSLSGISMPNLSTLPKVIAITTLAMAVTNLIPPIAALGVGLAQTLPLLLALPGLAVGAVAGVATLMVGLSGVGTALGAAAEGGEKYAEAMAKIAPNARSFVRGVNSLRDSFKGLQLGVQNELFAGMGREVRSLGQAYLPVLTKGMGELAGEVNDVVLAWSRMARSDRSLNDTSTMFENIRRALDLATPGITAFADGLRTLARIGTSFLPGMGNSFTEMGERFRDWVNAGDESGSIERAIEDAWVAAKKLGRVLTGLGGIIGGLFKGAAGDGDPLGAMADGLHRVSDIVNGPAFQKGLGQFFDGVGDGLSSIGDAMPAVADALVAIAPGLGSLARGFGQGLGTAIEAVAGFIERHADTFNRFAEWFENLDPKIQGAIAAVLLFAPIIGSLVGSVMPVVGALGSLLLSMGWVGLAVGLVIGVIAALALGFYMLYQNSESVRDAVSGIGDAFSELLAVLEPIAEEIGRVLSEVWEDADWEQTFADLENIVTVSLEAIRMAIEGFTIIVNGLWTLFGESFLETLTGFMESSRTVFEGALTAISGVFTMFSAIMKGDWSLFWEGLQQTLSGYSQAMGGLVTMMWTLISGAFSIGMTASTVALQAGWSIITGINSMMMTALTTAIQMGWALIVSIFQIQVGVVTAVVQAGWSIISSVFTVSMGIVQGIVQAGWAVISSVFTVHMGIVQGIVQGGWAIVTAVTSAVLGTLPGIVSGVWALVQAAFQTAVSIIQGIVQGGLSLLVGIAEAALSPLVGVVDWITGAMSGSFEGGLSGIPGIVTGVFSGLPGALFSIGADLAGSLASGLLSKVGEVASAATTLASMVANVMPSSPVKKGPLRSWNYGSGVSGAGRKLGTGVAEGLVAQRRDVATAADSMAGGVALAAAVPDSLGSFGGSRRGAAVGFTDEGLAGVREAVREGAYSGTAQQRSDTYATSASLPRGRARG